MPPSSQHSRSRDPSRPSVARNTSLPYVPMQPESLILPDGPVGEDDAELLDELVHRRRETQDTLVAEDEDSEQAKRRKLPWWKRPSPWWILAIMPFTSMAGSATIAPRIEIYTMLACSVHKPDIFRLNFPGVELGLQGFSDVKALNLSAPNTTPVIEIPIHLPQMPAADADAGDHEEPTADPRKRGNQCASDPVVQAAVAKLTAVIAGIMGVLSCITTGWWGAFSDRHGRTRVMGLSVLGLLITDINFIFVALFSKHIPGGYWFLVVAPFIEGGLGGLSAGVAALHAYMADTTEESLRSRNFSLGLGLMFSGMAFGPTVGSLLIRATGHTLSVFYLATATHALYTVLVWLILPESLSRKQMTLAKEKYEAEGGAAAADRGPVGILVKLRRLFAFLSPLTVFMPYEVKGEDVDVNPLKKPKKDWNLTFMALAYASIISIAGSYSYKFQYAAATFGWTSEELGYWLSLLGITRAVFLTFILPLVIKILKPKPIVIEIPVQSGTSESSPLLGSSPDAESPAPKTIKKEIHSPSFDLKLLHFSVLIEIIAYTAMAFSVRPLPFTLFAVLGSLGAGFSPALQSVALALYTRAGGTEIGRLFGALSVVQALSMQIFGPSLYGVIYMKTVAIFPRAIFFVTVSSIVVCYIFLNLVRLPKDRELRRQSMADPEEEASTHEHVQEETLVGGSDSGSQQKRLVDTPTTSYGAAGGVPRV
ncbi:hypothetical protein D9619_005275 [Psilocybe cf. subviscida]|uniref:Major facilitator superfamily (MFS) profile domain-containing protein n=1 Tax=Psilocybe cf. subviscida TaxID=2480587 RepID=A0A8H5BVZ3_9AGAR|nr:hypothetical protein D9619_005275 [Psilocybe cf. subviscida]